MSNRLSDNRTVKVIYDAGPIGFVFLLTYIGAAIYFVQRTGGDIVAVVIALVQALFWPAYVVFALLKMLGI